MDDLIYVWPDGTCCGREELSEFLRHKEDDYETMTWDEFTEQCAEETE